MVSLRKIIILSLDTKVFSWKLRGDFLKCESTNSTKITFELQLISNIKQTQFDKLKAHL